MLSDYQAMPKLRALGIADLFDEVLSAQDPDIGVFKPDPRGLEVALQRLDVRPAEALYVGDRVEVDAIAAPGSRGAVRHFFESTEGHGRRCIPCISRGSVNCEVVWNGYDKEAMRESVLASETAAMQVVNGRQGGDRSTALGPSELAEAPASGPEGAHIKAWTAPVTMATPLPYSPHINHRRGRGRPTRRTSARCPISAGSAPACAAFAQSSGPPGGGRGNQRFGVNALGAQFPVAVVQRRRRRCLISLRETVTSMEMLAILDSMPVGMVLPAHDGSTIEALRRRRGEFKGRCALPMASDDGARGGHEQGADVGFGVRARHSRSRKHPGQHARGPSRCLGFGWAARGPQARAFRGTSTGMGSANDCSASWVQTSDQAAKELETMVFQPEAQRSSSRGLSRAAGGDHALSSPGSFFGPVRAGFPPRVAAIRRHIGALREHPASP